MTAVLPQPYAVARATTDADLADLARMRVHWSTGEPGEPDATFVADFARWWGTEAGRRVAWVARRHTGKAAGMANAAIFERMPRPAAPPARWAYVANVWVEPADRRRGVGGLLMDAVVTWAREADMERIVLNPSEISLPLYRRAGFRPADDLMRLDLRA